MNNVILVGRLTKEPEIKENADGTFRTIITIAISRDYKNPEGIYETDFIRCILWNGIASATKEYAHKGDVVGLKGKLRNYTYEVNGEKKYTTEVMVDKISFMAHSSKKEISPS